MAGLTHIKITTSYLAAFAFDPVPGTVVNVGARLVNFHSPFSRTNSIGMPRGYLFVVIVAIALSPVIVSLVTVHGVPETFSSSSNFVRVGRMSWDFTPFAPFLPCSLCSA